MFGQVSKVRGMLDIGLYRMSESLAKQAIRTWRYAQVHRLDVFEKAGFPVRISNIGELDQIVGSMHNNDRFIELQAEIAGFDGADLDLFTAALADFYEFHATAFRRPEITMPLAEMIAHLAIYKMISAYRSDFRSVLEIGPGNGLLAFFLRRHTALENYTQIEACESFYMLQSLICAHLFGSAFDEWARPRGMDAAANCYVGDGQVAVQQFTRKPELNPTLPLDVDTLCHHVPWWRIGEVAERGWTFDVVTSNANLLEFTPEALNDYVSLMHQALADDGILYVQCFGGRVNGQVADAVAKLYAAGFRSLLLVPDGGTLSGHESGLEKRLALGNGVFVKEGHSEFDKAPSAPPAEHVSDCDTVRRMCFSTPLEGRRQVSEADVLQVVTAENRRRRTTSPRATRAAA